MPSTAAEQGRGSAASAAGEAGTRTSALPGDGQAWPPVFLCPRDRLAGEEIVLSGREGHHAATVRRLRPGERVDVTDGAGLVAQCTVTATRPGAVALAVRSRHTEPRPHPAVTVAQALPKGDRGQLAVELMTEAGVDAIIPWSAQRCVTRWQGERGERALGRWRAAAREAAKQARRSWLPEVSGPVTTSELLGQVASAELAVLLDPAAAIPLARLPVPGSGRILVIVGPEGGVSPAELAALSGAGAVSARLGPTVLRTSTAGLVAVAILLSRCGRGG
jgi:16S rRNA (uracil1498-N3)-methyltransferase